MTTLIDPTTAPESVQALVATWRYFKHDVETSITLLKKHQDWAKKHTDTDGLSYQDRHDLIVNLEDMLDRGTTLERKTFPEEYSTKRNASKSNTDPSSEPVVETLL